MIKTICLFLFLNKNIRKTVYTKILSSDEKNIILFNSTKNVKPLTKHLFKGYDQRNNITENTDIMKIIINNEKLFLLKSLNDPTINMYDKIIILNENNHLFNYTSSSMLNGGLYNDWDYDF